MKNRVISDYDLSELEELSIEIEKELRVRHAQNVKIARREIIAIARNFGLSPADLFYGRKIGKSRCGVLGTKLNLKIHAKM